MRFFMRGNEWHSSPAGDDGLSITNRISICGLLSISMGSLTHFYYLTLIVVGPRSLFVVF